MYAIHNCKVHVCVKIISFSCTVLTYYTLILCFLSSFSCQLNPQTSIFYPPSSLSIPFLLSITITITTLPPTHHHHHQSGLKQQSKSEIHFIAVSGMNLDSLLMDTTHELIIDLITEHE